MRRPPLLTILATIVASALLPSLDIPVTEQALALTATGRGDQIYQCSTAPAAIGGYAWTLVGPKAVLSDAHGVVIGRHYAGPTWEASDGSKVVGKVLAKQPSPNGGVDWLLLKMGSTSGGGLFATVTYIRRLATSGGAAPSTGCAADTAGRSVSIPYSATYEFYHYQR